MKKENKQLLVDLYLQVHYKDSSLPQYARTVPKFEDSTANGLTKCVILFLNLNQHQAERISIVSRQVKGRLIKSSMTVGTADISATVFGKSVKIEIKVGRDKQSEAQKEYQKRIEAAGGVYFLTHSFDEFICQYNELIKNRAL